MANLIDKTTASPQEFCVKKKTSQKREFKYLGLCKLSFFFIEEGCNGKYAPKDREMCPEDWPQMQNPYFCKSLYPRGHIFQYIPPLGSVLLHSQD